MQTPELESKVEGHFVTFIEHKNHLIELKGDRETPLNHGPIQVGLLEASGTSLKSWYIIPNQ